MKKLTILCLTIAVLLTTMPLAAAGDDFSLPVRLEHANGEFTQLGIFPSLGINPWLRVSMVSLFERNNADLTIGPAFKKGLFWATPYTGIHYDTVAGHMISYQESFLFGVAHPWFDFMYQNFYEISVRKAEMGSNDFQRIWLQVGNKDHHFKLGIQAEIFCPQDEDDQWLRSTVKVGPRVSLMKKGVRVDWFYGLVVADPTPDVKNDTPPTTRVWVWIFF